MPGRETINSMVPVLADGLHFNRLSEDAYILSNATHRHYLKINGEVYALLQLVDGKRTLEMITHAYNSRQNGALNPEAIYQLLYEKLAVYGILPEAGDKIKAFQKPAYLRLSFIIINERLLSRIVKYFYFLFNKKVAAGVLTGCILLIAVLLYLNIDIYRTFDLNRSLIYFFIVMALSVTFHEIGHAASASYFGARHGGIGGGFYLITPVYFADVTDIWRLSRPQRIVVNLAGMYFELVFCSALSLLALLLNNYTLLIIAVIVSIRTFFNLNPFLRSDGYWVLSDLTNKPNLLYHATQKARDVARLIFKWEKPVWSTTDYFLLLYGLISYGFICVFLYYVLSRHPNSIIYFPKNLANLVKSIFRGGSEFTLVHYAELAVPLIFFILLYRFVKSLVK